MTQIVVKTFDYYNTRLVLPGYTVPGYEKESETSKAYYSTDFSSNPIGSKVDFFVNLNDPCVAITAPNPVFDAPIGLSAMGPQWFDGWWDEAMFYSHPKTLQQLKISNPDTYQDFSESVGTLTYIATDVDPVNPLLNPKIPPAVLAQIKTAKENAKTNFYNYSPAGMGPSKIALVNTINNFTKNVINLRKNIETASGLLKNKLPFAVLLAGNLLTPGAWKKPDKIEGIQTAVDRINGVIKTPGRLLANGLDELNKLLLKIPKLPSLSDVLKAIVPDMPSVSKILSNIKSGISYAKSVISQGQAIVGQVVGTADQVLAGAGDVVGTINTEYKTITQTKSELTTAINNAKTSVQDLNKTVTNGGVVTTLKAQKNNALIGLNSNAAVIINTQVKNAKGNTAITKINTFQYPPKP